jgi:hypothetical protein
VVTPIRGPSPNAEDDVVLALPYAIDRVPLASKIRGTVLSSSLAVIEAAGLRKAYFAVLPRADHAAMQSIAVGEWLPMELGLSHYRALDTLAVAPEQAREYGRRVADRAQKSYLVTMIKTVGLGTTPWPILARAQSVLDRLVQRASVAVYREGPKEARLEIHGVPIAEFSYVRSGWAGMIEGGIQLVAPRAYCRDVSPAQTRSVAKYLITWA